MYRIKLNMIQNSYYNYNELSCLGLKSIGQNVKISKKASIYGAENILLGDNVRIDDFCILSGKIDIGNYVHIAAYSALYGSDKGIFIDDFASISSRVCIYSVSDDYSGKSMTNPTIPDEYKDVDNRAVFIEKHVIIGSTSIILPGVTLKEGSAFGCFSLVKENSEPWSINVGIPARKIKDRERQAIMLEKKFLTGDQL